MQLGSTLLVTVIPLIAAFLLGRLYAVIGSDEYTATHSQTPKLVLHLIHHWQAIIVSLVIAVLYALGLNTESPWTEVLLFLFWLGIGLFLEDFIYHIAHGGWWGEADS